MAKKKQQLEGGTILGKGNVIPCAKNEVETETTSFDPVDETEVDPVDEFPNEPDED